MTKTRKFASWLALLVIGLDFPSPVAASIVTPPPEPRNEAAAQPDVPVPIRPAHEAASLPSYAGLEAALEHYQQIALRGGWPMVPDGPSLSLGMSDPGIPALRRRLRATGDLAEDRDEESSFDYDLALEEGVRAFQRRHGLGADGVVGQRTRAALNASVYQRIEQIKINLERLGNMPQDLGERYVLVNIPAYSLVFVSRGITHIDSPVVVGRSNWRTPTFSSEITDVIFNPSWYVPSSIASREMLPRNAAEPGYLSRQGILVTVSEQSVRLRQPPGPRNPLGRVKFQTPNAYGVFLHDTPNKNLMKSPIRAHSHGCVRVRDAVELAFTILREDPAWNAALEKKVFANWRTRHVTLETPVRVHLIYLTAWAKDGLVNFREDVYRWDRRLAPTTTAAAQAVRTQRGP